MKHLWLSVAFAGAASGNRPVSSYAGLKPWPCSFSRLVRMRPGRRCVFSLSCVSPLHSTTTVNPICAASFLWPSHPPLISFNFTSLKNDFLLLNHIFSLASTFIYTLSSSTMSIAVECGNNVFNAVNATGSVQFPGFQFRQSEPTLENYTWRISTAVTESLLKMTNTTNTTKTQQDFWLNTNPLVTSNLTDLPYWGCIFLLQGFKQELISTGTNGSASCNGVFDSDCYDAITSVATSSAWKFNTNVASIVPIGRDIRQAITSSIPSQCKNSPWTSFIQAGKWLAAMFASTITLVISPEHC